MASWQFTIDQGRDWQPSFIWKSDYLQNNLAGYTAYLTVATASIEAGGTVLLAATSPTKITLGGGAVVVTDGVTVINDSTVKSATVGFLQTDVGRSVAGAGIPLGALIMNVVDATRATIGVVDWTVPGGRIVPAYCTATAAGVTVTVGPSALITVNITAAQTGALKPRRTVVGEVYVVSGGGVKYDLAKGVGSVSAQIAA